MHASRFDTLARAMAGPVTRRTIGRALTGLALGGAFGRALPLAGALAMFAPGGAAARCRGARRCGRGNCCAKGEVCGDREAKRCAPRCNDACFARPPGCGCSFTFDTSRGFCAVVTDPSVFCPQPVCDSHEDCAPDGFCAFVSAGACESEATARCVAACPAE
jgi:hypothetical protein